MYVHNQSPPEESQLSTFPGFREAILVTVIKNMTSRYIYPTGSHTLGSLVAPYTLRTVRSVNWPG